MAVSLVSTTHVCMYFSVRLSSECCCTGTSTGTTGVGRSRFMQLSTNAYIWMNVHGQYIEIPSCSVRVYVCVYIRTYVCMYVSVHW